MQGEPDIVVSGHIPIEATSKIDRSTPGHLPLQELPKVNGLRILYERSFSKVEFLSRVGRAQGI